MDKSAKELIAKLAGETPPNPKPGQRPLPQSVVRDQVDVRKSKLADIKKKVNASMASAPSYLRDRMKKSSMQDIIDDIIKGAEQNSFGRPVNVQTNTEWTHLNTAKTAGALQLLAERGYSVKEAAEFLEVSEEVVQAVLAAVG